MKRSALLLLTLSLCLFFGIRAAALDLKPARVRHSHIKRRYSMDELVSNLQYDFSKATIRQIYNDRLDQLANLIIEKKYAVALRGFADSVGTFKGNWVLSQKRSDAVRNYLVKAGVPARLIISTAFGSTQPIASNKTAAGRQENRRVEIKLKPIDE